MNRRTTVMGLIVTSLLLASCSSSDDTAAPTTAATTDAAAAAATTGSSPDTDAAESTPPVDSAASNSEPEASAPPETLPTVDQFRVGFAGEPATLDVLNQAELSIARLFYDPLVDMNEDGEFVPGLATSWNSDDGIVWRVDLRGGVTFHDGTPFDADAVVAHYDRLRDPANACACAADLAVIADVAAVDDDTVQFTLTSPYGGFVAQLADITSYIESPTAVAASGSDFGQNPVGTGPFVFSRWDAGVSLDVTRNDAYWGLAVRAANLQVRFLPDAQARFAALRAGDVDLINEADVRAADEANADDSLQVINLGGGVILFAALNTSKPPFNDVRARLALQYATDRESIVNDLYGGFYSVVDDPFYSSRIPTDRTPFPRYDLDKATELVQELGGLSFTFTTVPTTDALEQAQVLQAMWQQAGMQVDIRQLDRAALIDASVSGDFDATVALADRFTDPDLAVYSWYHTGAGRNFGGFSDPALDKLLDEGREEPDPAAREAIYSEASARMAELVPYLYLQTFSAAVVARRDVAGVPLVPDNVIRLAGATRTG